MTYKNRLKRAESSGTGVGNGAGKRKLWFTVVCLLAVAALGVGVAVADGPIVGPDATFNASADGPTVEIAEELTLEHGEIFPDEHTVRLAGHAEFYSEGETEVRVEQITGDFTNLTTTDVLNQLIVDPEDKQAIWMFSDRLDTLNFSQVDVSVDDEAELVYEAGEPEFEAEEEFIELGTGVAITELPPGAIVEAVDPETGEVFDTAQVEEDEEVGGVAFFDLPATEGTQPVAFTTATEEFVVQDVDPADPVTEGDDLDVDVTVANMGSETGTQTVELDVDSEQDGEFDVGVDGQEVELAPEESETVTLTYTTQEGDSPEVDVRGSTDDDSMTETASVEEAEEPPEDPPDRPDPEANFDISITATNSPVTPGATLVTNVTVDNTGSAAATQDVSFDVADFNTSDSVSLEAGRSTDLTFEWEPTTEDIGTHTATVTSDDDTDATDVVVEGAPPEYVSGLIPTDAPSNIILTFDQDVLLNPETPADAGFRVEIDGSETGVTGASAEGDQVQVDLERSVEADEDVFFSYDGESDNIVNEQGLEALPFTGVQITNEAEPTVVANLTAIDPTLGEPSDRFSLDVTTEEGVDFSAADSLVPPGVDATYEWEIGDETFTTDEPELREEFLEPGTYSASVTVTADGLSDTASFTLEVVDDTPPDVVLTAEESIEVGEDAGLDASESTDNVEIAEFQWDFGDGTTDSGAELTQPEHAFDEPGEYTVEVTVVDTSENEASETVTVEVEEDDDDGFVGSTESILLLLLLVLLAAGGGYYYMRRRR